MQEYKTHLLKLFTLAHLLKDQNKQYYFLCGHKKSGKKTLIHYLLDVDMELEVDDEGQECFKIQNQEQKIVIFEGILELYNFNKEDDDRRYIWLDGFSSDHEGDNKILWYMSLDFILSQLSKYRFKIILTHSPHVGEETQAILKHFCTDFKIVKNLADKCTIIITRVYDEEQMHEFSQNVESFVEEDENLQCIKDIIDKETIFCFCAVDIDSDTREQLKNNLSLHDKTIEELGEAQLDSFQTSKIYNEMVDKKEEWAAGVNSLQVQLFSIKNMLIMVALQIKANEVVSPELKNQLEQKWNEFFNEEIDLSVTEGVKEAKIVESYEKIYTAFYKMPDSFLDTIKYEFKIFLSVFSSQSLLKKISTFEQLLAIWDQGQEMKTGLQLQSIDKIFASGLASEAFLSKVYPPLKSDFSPEILTFLSNKKSVGNKEKTKTKKVAKKVVVSKYPDYEDQKKSFKGDIKEVMSLSNSPLKFDLLAEELEKSIRMEKRVFQREKILIKYLMKILEFYNMWEQSLTLAKMIPDFNSIEIMLEQIICQYQEKSSILSEDNKKFLEQVILFCLENNRRYIVNQAINLFVDNEQLMQKYDEKEQEGFRKTEDGSAFMDKKYFEEIVSNKKNIIERMISYENLNWKNVQLDLCIYEIINGNLNLVTNNK